MCYAVGYRIMNKKCPGIFSLAFHVMVVTSTLHCTYKLHTCIMECLMLGDKIISVVNSMLGDRIFNFGDGMCNDRRTSVKGEFQGRCTL